MADIIDLNDYKTLKQKEFFINLYHFLNKSVNYGLDDILLQIDEDFTKLCKEHRFDPVYVNFFRIPMITFMVITFVNNSDIKRFFPPTLYLDNDENKHIFRNTLIKVMESLEENYDLCERKKAFEEDIQKIIEEGLERILRILPDEIILV